jgi:hypothetical protein
MSVVTCVLQNFLIDPYSVEQRGAEGEENIVVEIHRCPNVNYIELPLSLKYFTREM